MQNLFQQLKSKHQKKLLSEAERYSSVSRLIANFEGKSLWTDITISEFNCFCTWANVNTLECSIFDVKYGDKFLKKTKK
jgi:hypothetical protein